MVLEFYQKVTHKKVPQDFSIIGYDNVFLSRIIEPKLTTMVQNMFQLGYTAATGLSMGQSASQDITFENVLIERGSTGLCKNN